MRALVYLKIFQGSWVYSKGGKNHFIILVITNFIIIAIKPSISNNLIIFRYFTRAMRSIKAAFLQITKRNKIQWKV